MEVAPEFALGLPDLARLCGLLIGLLQRRFGTGAGVPRPFAAGTYQAAESALQQAVREQPGGRLAQKLLGLSYSAQEKYALAEQPLRRAREIDPQEENACYYLGRVYYSLN